MRRHTGLRPPLVPPHPAKPFWPWGAGVFVTALALRLVHIWQIRRAPFFSVLLGDAREYDAWAQRIAQGDWIGSEVFYQAPLYPYFLGLIYTLFGRDLLVVRLCQAILGSLACVLLALTARRLFSPRVGIVAGFALALYAPAVFFDSLIQKSVLDIFFVCLALYCLTRLIDESSRRAWLWLGVVMGGLCLTRENALILVAVILAWSAVRQPGNGGARPRDLPSRHTQAAAFLVGLAIVLTPVVVRNYAVSGGFYLTTSQFGPNFYIGNNARSDGTYMSLRPGRGAPEYERQDATELAEHALGRRLAPAEVSSYWTRRAQDFITSEPGAWLQLVARKFALLWNADEMVDTESQETYAEWSLPLRAGAWIGHFGILVPLAVLGVLVTWPDRRRLSIFYILMIAYACSVLMFYVFARYRFPLVPMLMLFASAGLAGAGACVRSATSHRSSFAAVAAVAAVGLFTNWPMLSGRMMRAVTENNLAVALQAEGRIDDALRHYERATQLQPDYAPAFNNMGTALRAKGHVEKAMAAYRQALDKMPDYPDAHFNLANALLERQRRDEAAEHFRIALQSVPGSADALNNLAIALAEAGRLNDAIMHFRQALASDPQSATVHRNLGNALAGQGRTEDAVTHLTRAVELAPRDSAARYDLGSILLESSRFSDAALAFRQALELQPDSVGAYNNLGIALASQGRLDEAIGAFERALQLQPDFPDAARNLARARQVRQQLPMR